MPIHEVNIFLMFIEVICPFAIGIKIAAISNTNPTNIPWLSITGNRYLSKFISLINKSIQVAIATELAFPSIDAVNIAINIILESNLNHPLNKFLFNKILFHCLLYDYLNDYLNYKIKKINL